MPGQHGNKRITQPNLKVVRLFADENVVFLSGSVPGARNAFVVVRGAQKQKPSS
jgi:large subunit ribosomal protein L3